MDIKKSLWLIKELGFAIMVSEKLISPAVLWASLDLCNGQQQTHCQRGGCCFHKELIFYCCDLAPSCGHLEFSQL